MENSVKVAISEVKPRANHYHISGNMMNGHKTVNGEVIPILEREYITRPIAYIDHEKGRLHCVCGRVFIVDDELELIECSY